MLNGITASQTNKGVSEVAGYETFCFNCHEAAKTRKGYATDKGNHGWGTTLYANS